MLVLVVGLPTTWALTTDEGEPAEIAERLVPGQWSAGFGDHVWRLILRIEVNDNTAPGDRIAASFTPGSAPA